MTAAANTDAPRQFLEVVHPPLKELHAVHRELIAIDRRAMVVQADWVWRLRAGETLTLERVRQLLPDFPRKEKLLPIYLNQLLTWGVLATLTPEITLALDDR